MADVLYIRSRNADEPPPAAYRTAPFDLEVVDVRDLPDAPAALGHRLVVVPMQSDEIMLSRKSAWLEGAWRQGVAILANDIVALPYMPFLTPFEPIPLPGLGDFQVQPCTPHPAFDRLPFDSFHLREGMAGVYGVGHNPPPEGAVVVNTIGHGAYAIDWYLENDAGGVFFCHGGPDISAFHSGPADDPNLTHHLMRWLLEPRR